MHYHEKKRFYSMVINTMSAILPFTFWFLMILSFDSGCVAGITLISAVIHELGHEIYLYLKLGKIHSLKGALHGLKMRGSKHLSYKEETILYISGPLANLICAIISLPFIKYFDGYILYFAVINLATAGSNLIPVEGYDGYGILKCFLLQTELYEKTHIILDILSFAFTLALSLLSLYIVDRFGESYWIFAVFLISLLSQLTRYTKSEKS